MRPVINVNNLSKQYFLGARDSSYSTLRETLVAAVQAPFARLRRRNELRTEESLWALRDLNLRVYAGERLGIVGHNGAGKSTLLKILSRITEPTAGRVELCGRVGSLLEVGTGFHPELTGRENIALNGAMLGMKREEIAQKFDEIVAFAEIERFLDTPVKRYSSGMYTRLAFAVAAHLEPEILIVDEVLAVGDASFQKKCLGKMNEVARAGRTVIFVSHNMTAIRSLCSRAIWLDNGAIVEEGTAEAVATNYLKTSFSTLNRRVWDDRSNALGNSKVRLHRAQVRPADASLQFDAINVRTPFVIEFEYWNLVPGAQLNLSLVLYNDEGMALFNTGPVGEPVWHGKPFPAGLFRSQCYVPGDLMNDGTHRVKLFVVQDQTSVIFSAEDVLVFDIMDSVELRTGWYGKILGAVRPQLEWTTELIASEDDRLDSMSLSMPEFPGGLR